MPTTGETTAFSILDVGTDWCDVFPEPQKSADHAVGSLIEFAGGQHPNSDSRIRCFYTDGSEEFASAGKTLGVHNHPKSTRLRHQSNTTIEQLNRKIKEGTRTILYKAGFHQRWWPHAARHYCFARNTGLRKGNSSWHRRFKRGHFKGLRIPFGASVRYRVAVRKKYLGEFDVSAQEGVFIGWKMHPGSKWRREYLVVPLEKFQEEGAWRNDYKAAHVLACREILYDSSKPQRFPLKEAYDEAVGKVKCPAPVVSEAQLLGTPPGDGPDKDDVLPGGPEDGVDDAPPPGPAPSTPTSSEHWRDASNLVQVRRVKCRRFLTLERRDPRWNTIARRVTRTPDGEILEDEQCDDSRRGYLYKALPDCPEGGRI